jgi:hypothetical protein
MQKAKDAFLVNDKFAAPPGSARSGAIAGALTDVHHSAFGHNPTWRLGIDMATRARVHRRHDELLVQLVCAYESGIHSAEEHFIEDIAFLVTTMNTEFGRYFR